jgi:hypothetical protein
MRVFVCPFCGVATKVPHETQELCIEALQAEIALVREMVHRVRDASREYDGGDEDPGQRSGV